MAQLKRWTGAAWQAVNGLSWFDGTAFIPKPLKRWTGSAWEIVSSPLSASASQPAGGVESDPGTVTVTTGSSSVTVTGGTGAYSFAWEKVSGDVEVTANAPLAQNCSFSADCGPGEVFSADFRCEVTDTGSGLVVYTNTITATCSNIGSG